jgi:opacity protein-like surface antigen
MNDYFLLLKELSMKGCIKTILPYLGLISCINLPALANTLRSASTPNSWTIGGSALALQPALADPFVYGIISTYTPNTTTDEVLKQKFSWGFDLFARYNFNQNKQDLSASYMDFESSDTSQVSIPLSSNYIYNDFYHTALGSSHLHVNAADILAGQNITLRDAVQVHGTLGVGYASLKIKNKIANDQGWGTVPNIVNESYSVIINKLSGAGPKLGIDGEYKINQIQNLSLVGGASLALLIGSQHITSISNSTTNINKTPANTNITNINGNIGLRYHAEARMPVNAEVGYKVNDYINTLSLAGVYLTLSTTI